MSSHPEEEYVSESGSEVDVDVDVVHEEFIESGEEGEEDYLMTDEEGSDIPEIFDEPLQMEELLSSVLATPDGDTVCSALVNIAHQLEVQNKILIKVLSAVNKK